TKYTTKSLKWVWYDGPGAPAMNQDLVVPGMDIQGDKKKQSSAVENVGELSLDPMLAGEHELPEQGAMFVGEKGRLLLPHFMQLPKKIVKGEYVDISKEIAKVSEQYNLGQPIRNYDTEGPKHYHEFVDAC